MDGCGLTDTDRAMLLNLARTTLEKVLSGKMPETPKTTDFPTVRQHRGAFVSLHRGTRLRGCIGTFENTTPLWKTVQRMAVQAALYDPRFPAVTLAELPSLNIEISALTPLVESAPDEIQVGKHGVMIEKKERSGVLLPQVATQHGWDREEFLQHTCLKAGLPPEAWRKDATIWAFQADVFQEKK